MNSRQTESINTVATPSPQALLAMNQAANQASEPITASQIHDFTPPSINGQLRQVTGRGGVVKRTTRSAEPEGEGTELGIVSNG